PPQRLLRRQVPVLQIAPDGPHRNLNPELPAQQLLHGLAGPQRERQPQLVRTPPQNPAHRPRGLQRLETRTARPAALASLERPASLLLVAAAPAVDGSAGDLEGRGCLDLAQTSAHRFHDPGPQRFLRGGRQRPGILDVHERHCVTVSRNSHLYYALISNRPPGSAAVSALEHPAAVIAGRIPSGRIEGRRGLRVNRQARHAQVGQTRGGPVPVFSLVGALDDARTPDTRVEYSRFVRIDGEV